MKRRLLSMLMALVAIMTPIGAWALGYTLEMPKTGIATLYLPFALELPEGVRAYIVTDIISNDDGTVQLVEKELTGGIPASTPVIIRGDQASYTFTIATKGFAEIQDNNLLKGTLVPMSLDVSSETGNFALYGEVSSDYWLNIADWQAHSNNGTSAYTLGANRAYLQLPTDNETWTSSKFVELKALFHLQHTHGDCDLCDIEANWDYSAADLTSYGTLAEAVDAAGIEGSNIGYIKLLADVKSENGIYIEGGNFTLDLNGHTISSESHTLVIRNQSNVTIVDNSETKSGKVISSGEGSFAVGITNSASVTINGGTYESPHLFALNLEENSSATINGGSYVNSYLPVQIGEGSSATIMDGIFEYTSNGAIDNYGNLVVEGGTFTYKGEGEDLEFYHTIYYYGGSIDLSKYPTDAINSIDVTNNSGEDITPGAETILLPEGYYFLGSNGTPVTILENNSSYCIGEEPAKYAVTFEASGGEGEMEGSDIYEGNYTLPECAFTAPEGMVFKAWQIGEKEYQPGDVVTIKGETTITALWTTLFEVSFDANGGTGSMDAVTTISDFTLPECTFTAPEGMVFKAWQIGVDEFKPGNVVTIEANTTITALWATLFEVSFDANGGTGSMDAVTTIGNFILPECTFTAPEGMVFKAWQIGVDEFKPGEGVTIEANTTITALWATLFEVSFDANGGTGSMDAVTTISDFTLPECTFIAPEGMMFKAWKIGEEEYQPYEPVSIEGETTITALWTAYVPQIIIKMHDSYGDTWNQNAIVVKKNDVEIGTATIEYGANGIVRYNYDNTADYTFYWQKADYPHECSFEILIDDEEVFAAVRDEDEGTYDCENYEDGELIYTIEHTACPHTSFSDGVCEDCGVTGGYCGAETNEGGVESVRWAISEDGSTLTIRGEGAMADYEGYSNNPWWRNYCQTISTIVISDGITRIGNDAFGDLDGITDIVIPSSVTTIGSNTFCGCSSLNTVTLNKGLRVIEGNAFVQCKVLTTITIPDGVTEIGVNAFNYCSNLASINIPHSVTTIGQSAFTANISTVYVSCSPQFEYTFGANTTIVYAEHEYEDGFCTVCGKIDGRIQDGEHESFYVEENLENVDITYTRTLPNLMWNALYVPFEIPVSELEDNYDVAYVNDVHSFDTDDDGEIDDLQMEIIKITSGTLKANYPYLIRAKNEGAKKMELILDDATLCATEWNTVTCSSVFMQFDVTGTYYTMSQDGDLDILAISTDGSWKKLAEGTALKPFRLYLTLTAIDGSPVKVEEEALTRMRIVIRGEEGNETGIDQITTSHDKQTTTYFDLSGRRVKTPVKGGLYIVNGKKVVY